MKERRKKKIKTSKANEGMDE